MCVAWRKYVDGLGTGDSVAPSWGPSVEDMMHVRISQVTAAVIDLDIEDREDEEDGVGVVFDEASGDEEANVDLYEALETVDSYYY